MDDLLFNPFAEEDITSPLTPQSIPIDPPKEEFVTPETPAETVEPTLSLSDIAHLKTSLLSLKTQVDSMLDILKGHKAAPGSFSAISLGSIDFDDTSSDQRVLEGIFDGEKMVGDDAGIYTIPPNYASKSKLVEGDRLKLTITANGSFIYKQVKPIGRKRLVGELVFDQELNQWGVFSEGKLYKVLKASVTFYKGNAGDESIVLVADDRPCVWGAIENIIHK